MWQINNPDYVTLTEIDRIHQISTLMFADDLIWIETSKSGWQNLLNALQKYTKKWMLEINCKKSKYISFPRSNHKYNQQFTINNQILQNINEYKYLGMTLNKTGSFLPTLDELSN